MKRVLSWLGKGLAALVVLILLVAGARQYAMHRFVSDWKKRFPTYKENMGSLPAVDLKVGLPGDTRPPEPLGDAKLVINRFEDGSWFVVAEHDSHDEGLEWDRAVFYDSRGNLRVTGHHFCSWEGLLGELSRYAGKSKSLDDFYREAAGIF